MCQREKEIYSKPIKNSRLVKKITIGKSLEVGEEPGVWKWLIGSQGAAHNKRPGHVDQDPDELSHKGDWLK